MDGPNASTGPTVSNEKNSRTGTHESFSVFAPVIVAARPAFEVRSCGASPISHLAGCWLLAAGRLTTARQARVRESEATVLYRTGALSEPLDLAVAEHWNGRIRS